MNSDSNSTQVRISELERSSLDLERDGRVTLLPHCPEWSKQAMEEARRRLVNVKEQVSWRRDLKDVQLLEGDNFKPLRWKEIMSNPSNPLYSLD